MDTVLTHSYRSVAEINSAMSRVYGYMFQALVVSIITSIAVASVPGLMSFFFTGIMMYVTLFLPLICIFGVGLLLANNPPREIAYAALLGFAVVMGLSMTAVLARNPWLSAQAFMGAATVFAVCSFWGYFTKQSLEGWGRYLLVAVIALLVVSVINLFLGSSMLSMIVSAIAVLVFSALTAYDTQRIREEVSSTDSTAVAEIAGALSLYMNLINIWLSLINLFSGDRE